MLKRRIFNFAALLLMTVQLFSQTPSYYHYTSSDGLASSTVLSIIQDKNGFIWFATLNGLSKFDGKHFTTYRTGDGLNSNSITSLAEGEDGELYISNYENGINVFKNGRIENYCSAIGGKSFATSFLMLTPPSGDTQRLYTYRAWGLINVINVKTRDRNTDQCFSTYPQRVVKLDKLKNGTVIALTINNLCQWENNTLTKISIPGLPESNNTCLAISEDDTLFVGSKGMIFKIKNNSIITRYKINLFADNNDVAGILKDRNNNIWFSIMNRGLFLIPKGSDKIIDVGIKMDLQSTLVSNFLEDNEGNIWVSTFGKGVYCLNNLYLNSYQEKDGLSNNNVYCMARERTGKLIIGTFNGINVLENGKFTQVRSHSGETLTDYIYEISIINNNFYVCGTFGKSEMIPVSHKGLNLFMFSAPSFRKTADGYYLFGSSMNLISVHQNHPMNGNVPYRFYIFGDTSEINRVITIFEDSAGNIWIGTNMGLCKVVKPSNLSGPDVWKKSFFPSVPVLNSKISSIIQDDQNNVWFTGDKGISKYNLINDSVSSFTSLLGYDLSSSTSIVLDNKKRLWIGTMMGLYLYDGKSVKHLNSQTGLPSDEILSLCYDDGKNLLNIGTSNGLSLLDIGLFDKLVLTPPDVKIISIKAGDSIYTTFNDLIFKPKQNHVYINFKALSFSSPGSVRYKYKLNSEWAETEQNFLDLVSLAHGKFDLQIMARSQNTGWGDPVFIDFAVSPIFYETTVFRLAGILLIILLSMLIVTWRLRLNHKENLKEIDLNARINELKHQALSAMMNPHFIFNSLNSVQYLINSRRNEEANDYIAIMARLVRKNLDTAGKGMILLSEEIDRLDLYLKLEKLRLQESFSYEIISGENVDRGAVMIPNMIIQPFVENTLWHGIIDSGKNGLLTVSFSFEDIDIDSRISKALIIKITDNGIGINQARKNKKEDHVSKGILIIEERLRLLSTKMQIPQPIVFEDLSSRNNNSQGTEVIISLPPQLYQLCPPPSGNSVSDTV